ncbi:MAG: alpha/beta fold hydrolase [Rhodocyclaceae bacterium]|nr:alpha/beta fold hydrolase [Rhodocyclaceae bacterium]
MSHGRRIHHLHLPAERASGRPPLIFIHGGYVDAGCWAEHFLPFFQKHGHDSYAIDLSGHGGSEGRDRLDDFGLDDYAEDVAALAGQLDAPPVLVGHSMGAAVASRYLESDLEPGAQGVALLSPVPPFGMWGASIDLALKRPAFYSEMPKALAGEFSERTLEVMRSVYFAPDAPNHELMELARLIQPESLRAIADMTFMAWSIPRPLPHIPALVMGGELDALFPPHLLGFTARRWNGQAEVAVVPGTGHIIMLERHWRSAAERLAAWLDGIH